MVEAINWQQDLPPEAQQRREVFARFGLAAYQAQCVERQVAILLATTRNAEYLSTPPEGRDRFFEEAFRQTLGRLVTDLQKCVILPSDLQARLLRGLELRNWIAHNYFWERPREILDWRGRERMIAELQEAADFLDELDQDLTAVGIALLEALGGSAKDLQEKLEEFTEGNA